MWIPLVEASEELPQPKAGKQGAKKENQIGSSSGGQAWGANQSFQRFHHVDRSVRTPSYGNSPKKDEMVQACHGRLAGTAVLRGTDVVLDMQAKEGDPACTIIGQHFAHAGQAGCKLASGAQGSPGGGMGNHVGNAETKAIPLENCGGSARSSGRLPAQLRVASPSLKNWKQTSGQVKPWNFTQVEDRYAILQAMQAQIIQDRKRRIAKSYQCPELEKGIDWYGAKLSIKGTGMQKPCQTLWQGALRAGKDAWCARCEKPCSHKHLMWECDWWADNLQETE